jgi:predicted nuclease of predicted toxin-antitoxin system
VKRVLLDENLDWRLKRSFDPAFEVSTVQQEQWGGMANGDLLLAAQSNFDVLVTLDANLQYQQHVEGIDLAIIVIVARSSRRTDIEPHMSKINEVILDASPGTVTKVQL